MADTTSQPARGRYINLVIVCCHSIYTGSDGDPAKEALWLLKPFQSSDPDTGRPSEHRTYISHVFAGMQAIEDKETDQLMFSGGYTVLPELSEAQSYAKVFKYISPDQSMECSTEDSATDSFQNLLFSIVLFRRMNGAYPKRVTVVTHGFKERRFLELHAPAIKWPGPRIRVQGVNPPFTRGELESAHEGEQQNASRLFKQDPYGVHAPLSEKRTKRRWNEQSIKSVVFPGLETVVERLLEWKGGDSGNEIFPERLPWED